MAIVVYVVQHIRNLGKREDVRKWKWKVQYKVYIRNRIGRMRRIIYERDTSENLGREKARDGWRGYIFIHIRRSVYYRLEVFLLFKKGVDSSLSSS